MTISINSFGGQPVDASFFAFSGGERHVQIKQNNDERVFNVRADLRSSDDIFDLLLTLNALYEKNDKDAVFNIEIPYLPYSRQDRVCAPGQAFSLEVLSRVLKSFAEDADMRMAIKTWDSHSQVGLSLLGAKNIPSFELIAQSNELSALVSAEDSVLISPDKGATERTQQVAHFFGNASVVNASKVRDPGTGHILRTEIDVDSLEGKTAIIIDDICDGGMTFIKLAEALKKANATRVVLYVTHGIFSKGLDVFDGLIDVIYTTNSFTQARDSRLNVIAVNNNQGELS